MNAVSPLLSQFHPAFRRALTMSLVAVALAVVFLVGYWPRRASRQRLAAETIAASRSLPRVKVTAAVATPAGRSLTLPGSLSADQQTLVNARAAGYVRRWLVDIGDRVHAGDVLAELDTPELDQQLEQARATEKQKEAALEQAIANRDFAQITAGRQDTLVAQSLVAKQDDDQANAQLKIWQANVNASKADILAAQANVRELAQLVSFGRIVAPFDGRITQRNVDVGSLVTVGTTSGTSGGQPLFRIESIDPIRVFVQVPQAFALSVKVGAPANVTVRQIPAHAFAGRVMRTAGTLDPAARTLNVEIDVPNPTGELLAGMFAEVEIEASLAHRAIRVPSSAVITDARGVHVATVDGAGTVHLVAVQRGLDDGREIELVDGLAGGEQVMVSPGGDVVDGMRVEVTRGP
jgi:RND family efflux transporter MFP subunit